jgi:hypothetical protein
LDAYKRELDHLGWLMAQVEHSSEKFQYLDPDFAGACLALVASYRAREITDYRTAYVGVTRMGACLDGWSRRVCNHRVVSLQQRMAAQRVAEGL